MDTLTKELKKSPPFSSLTFKEFETLQKALKVSYYRENTLLLTNLQEVENIFCVIKGIVEVINEDTLMDVYTTNDIIGATEAIQGKVEADYIVSEDLICYEFPKSLFISLLQNEKFKSFFIKTIVEKTEQYHKQKRSHIEGEFMTERIRPDMLHPIVEVDAKTPLIDALQLQKEKKASTILVSKNDTLGIATDTDIRNALLVQEFTLEMPIDSIASYPLHSIEVDDFLFNALLMMTKYNIKRVGVKDSNDNIIGVLEQIDLLSFFSTQSYLITVQIERAKDIDQLITTSSHIDNLIYSLRQKGVKAKYIAKLVNEINHKIYKKLFALIIPQSWHAYTTLVVLGSEGRGEQIFKTDQDNALIFSDDFLFPENFESVTEKFTDTLLQLGYPKCKGDIMLNNRTWSKTIKEYKQDIDSWIEMPSSKGYMNLAILFDAKSFAGEEKNLKEVKEYLFKKVKEHPDFLPHFSKPIDNFESLLGIFSQFIKIKEPAHKDEMDIKKGALFTLIHATRALSLEFKIEQTNTFERLKRLNDKGFLSREDTQTLMDSLEILLSIRLDTQMKKRRAGSSTDNYINPNDLSKIERDLLKDALKMVEKYKKILTYHFKLSHL